MAGLNSAWGLTGGVGEEVGEKLHGVERNPWIASVGARTAGGGGAMEQQLPRRGYAAPAALRRGRSGEDRPERTSGRWRTDSEGSRGGGKIFHIFHPTQILLLSSTVQSLAWQFWRNPE